MKKIIYIMTFLTLLTTSCNNWLDVDSKYEVPATTMFETEQGFEDALIACYIHMNTDNLYGVELTMKCIDYLAQYWCNGNIYEAYQGFTYYSYSNAYLISTVDAIYMAHYNNIAQANLVLSHLDEALESGVISKTKYAIIKAEALTIRAMHHFDVLRMFGQLPSSVESEDNLYCTTTVDLAYVTEVTTETISMLDYSSFLTMLHADLDEAEELFSEYDTYMFETDANDDFYEYRYYRFNYYAILALQARVYLYTGNTTYANGYARSVMAATKPDGSVAFTLAGASGYLESDMQLLSESMFALQNYTNVSDANSLYNYTSISNPNVMTTADLELLFTGRNTASNNRYLNLWGLYSEANVDDVPFYKKYITSDVTSSSYLNVPMFRLSEMYLIAIECAETLAEANSLYKEYMVARQENITTDFISFDEVDEAVLNEYRIEFIGEGQMFYTYKRKGIKDMMWSTSTMTEANYILPLPTTEIQ